MRPGRLAGSSWRKAPWWERHAWLSVSVPAPPRAKKGHRFAVRRQREAFTPRVHHHPWVGWYVLARFVKTAAGRGREAARDLRGLQLTRRHLSLRSASAPAPVRWKKASVPSGCESGTSAITNPARLSPTTGCFSKLSLSPMRKKARKRPLSRKKAEVLSRASYPRGRTRAQEGARTTDPPAHSRDGRRCARQCPGCVPAPPR